MSRRLSKNNQIMTFPREDFDSPFSVRPSSLQPVSCVRKAPRSNAAIDGDRAFWSGRGPEFHKENSQVQQLKAIVVQQQKQIEALTAGLQKVTARVESCCRMVVSF